MLKQVTVDNLDSYIEFNPTMRVKATDEHVVAVMHDDSAVVCENDNGEVIYKHKELEYKEDVEQQRKSYYGIK